MRLFLRQRKWMPKNKISYPKIAFDLSPVLNNLVENCLLLDGVFVGVCGCVGVWVCVCGGWVYVYVCVHVWVSFVFVYVCLCACLCVRVCVCVRACSARLELRDNGMHTCVHTCSHISPSPPTPRLFHKSAFCSTLWIGFTSDPTHCMYVRLAWYNGMIYDSPSYSTRSKRSPLSSGVTTTAGAATAL